MSDRSPLLPPPPPFLPSSQKKAADSLRGPPSDRTKSTLNIDVDMHSARDGDARVYIQHRSRRCPPHRRSPPPLVYICRASRPPSRDVSTARACFLNADERLINTMATPAAALPRASRAGKRRVGEAARDNTPAELCGSCAPHPAATPPWIGTRKPAPSARVQTPQDDGAAFDSSAFHCSSPPEKQGRQGIWTRDQRISSTERAHHHVVQKRYTFSAGRASTRRETAQGNAPLPQPVV